MISLKTTLFVIPCDRASIKDFIETYHYSKSINGCKVSNCFKVLDKEGRLVGACLFGELSTTSWKKYGSSEKEVVELRRLVLLDECPKNSESYVVGACLRYLKKHTTYKVVVSYADPTYGHSGIIYRATNFLYKGKTSSDSVFLDTTTNKTYHSRALRTKYKGELKPFAKRLVEKLQQGLLIKKRVEGKHIYVFRLRK